MKRIVISVDLVLEFCVMDVVTPFFPEGMRKEVNLLNKALHPIVWTISIVSLGCVVLGLYVAPCMHEHAFVE